MAILDQQSPAILPTTLDTSADIPKISQTDSQTIRRK